MKYRVRNSDGELTFNSMADVEQAWLLGLVEPEDEVLEEGMTKWRKAKTIPVLVRARRTSAQAWGGTLGVWTFAAVMGASVALYMISRGNYWGIVPLILVALIMGQVTYRVNKRTKPH